MGRTTDSVAAVMSAASRSNNTALASTATQQAVFEFTRRKKWADLLITELSGTLIMVLSITGEVLYCGAAAVELLGWKEEEVIDTELASWMHEDDVAPFLAHFDSCIASRQEMSTFARLRGKAGGDAHWPVFELRGHGHYNPDQRDCQCFFVMARPYPSRNTSMLDSFLELKIENERLRQRLIDLRPSASSYPPPPYLSGASISNTRGGGADVMFPSDSLNGVALNMSSIYSSGGLSLPRAYQSHYFAGPPIRTPNPSSGGVALEEISPVQEHYPQAHSTFGGSNTGSNRSRPREVDDDGSHVEQPRRKKARKLNVGATSSGAQSDDNASSSAKASSSAPQYVCVTCGRTDSPEWRKGPLGAKTLCNACGLRWAKRNQKKKAETAANTADDDDGSAKETSRAPEDSTA